MCDPFPLPAHQTGRADFPHPAFRLASPRSFRRWPQVNVTQPKHAIFTENSLITEAFGALRLHLVATSQETPDTVVDVVVDCPICDQACTIAEVCAPSSQQAVQSVAHLRPRRLVPWNQDLADLLFEPLYALLRRTCSQIPMTILPISVRPESVTKEVEAFLPSVADRGLRLVQCQPEPGHHPASPRLGLLRVTAAEDDEVIGVGDNMGFVDRTPFASSPVFQETIHVDVGQRRADNTALRRAAGAMSPTAHASLAVVVHLLDRCLEPHLDEAQDIVIDDASRD
jgi:hypothetical protein